MQRRLGCTAHGEVCKPVRDSLASLRATHPTCSPHLRKIRPQCPVLFWSPQLRERAVPEQVPTGVSTQPSFHCNELLYPNFSITNRTLPFSSARSGYCGHAERLQTRCVMRWRVATNATTTPVITHKIVPTSKMIWGAIRSVMMTAVSGPRMPPSE